MSELKWIKHDGGPMPVPGDTIITVELGGYKMADQNTADALRWVWINSGRCADITAYAIVGDLVADTAPGIDAHYTKLKIEPMTYSMENGLDPMQHTVIKYVTRFRDKHGKRDLLAARHVIDMMIDREYGE